MERGGVNVNFKRLNLLNFSALTFGGLKPNQVAVLSFAGTVKRLNPRIIHAVEMEAINGTYRFDAAVHFLKQQYV